MMRNKTAKIIAGAVALLLAVLMIFSALASGLSYAGAAGGISSLKKQLSSIESQKAAVKREIAALGNKIDAASERKAALDKQMELTQDEIDTTKALIRSLKEQIGVKSDELDEAERALDEKTELFETRVRVMYENGDISYLDVLLSSDSFSDMLSNLEIVSQIMDYDKKVVRDYTAAKKDIEVKKASLESDKKDEETYQNSLESKYSALDDQKSEQQKIITELNANMDAKKAQAEKMEAEQESINSEIERLSREAAERAAAEAAARRKQQQQSGSSSSSSSEDSGVVIPTSGTFVWPLPDYGTDRISSPYGYRTHPITGKRKLHAGIDVGVPCGATIVAAASGTVVRSYMSSSYGNYTVIDHGGGVMTAYAHQSKRLVSAGEHVSAGQKIGLVGSTGNSTGNHLHFEVYVNGSTVNPMRYFN